MLFTHGCGGPPLEPWHTEKLRPEFTLRKAEEVRTFDDYRKLEDELFDINRFAVRSTLVVSDPAPLTDRLDKASGGN